MPKPAKGKMERILILCVDRDDDLGVKARIKTPILGRKENVNAATTLILRDPEEPDANAMFEAVRVYDRLREEVKETLGECQIATITGSELGGVGADRKLVSELTDVLKKFPATDVILVTDGYGDEVILPLVESRVPVTSVRRIVVAHSKSVEETLALFSRYLKILIKNPRYSRIALGLPGIFLLVLGILFPILFLYKIPIQPHHVWIALFLVFGTFLFVKGFGFDRTARDFYRWIREYSPPPFPVQITSFSTAAGLLLVAIGCYEGAFFANSYILENPQPDPSQWIAIFPRLVGEFISGSIALIVIGICVLFSGRMIRWFLERDTRVLRTFVIVVVCACSWRIFYEASQILINPSLEYTKLVIAIIASIILTVVAVSVTSLLHRKYARFFKEKDVEIEKG
jgi:putative membrane protein